MNVQILLVENTINKKTDEPKYEMTVLGNFSSYGSIKPATAQVRLNKDTYAKYKQLEGKSADIDVVIPKPDFPLNLV